MKRFMKTVLVAGTFVAGANGLFAAQASANWVDEIYKVKLGRAFFAEAQQRSLEANTVYREETPLAALKPANTWLEDYYRAKYGRNTPAEEARQRAERANTVYREEIAAPAVNPANTWRDDFWKAKYGRPFPNGDK